MRFTIRVGGRLTRAEGGFGAGTPYSATDPALLAWVHATLVDSFLVTYELFVRPLSPAERDAYCAESAAVETLLRVPAARLPRTAPALASYVSATLASGGIQVTDTARGLARAILWPPRSAPVWPGLALLRLATAGLLPPSLREEYDFRWDTRRAAALRVSATAVRRALPLTPSVLRHWPVARAARRTASRQPTSVAG